jgi:hypothetical protein
MWFRRKGDGIVFTLRSKQETRCLITIILHRLWDLDEQIESGKIRENIHQLKCEKFRQEFEKFTDELFENLNEDYKKNTSYLLPLRHCILN